MCGINISGLTFGEKKKKGSGMSFFSPSKLGLLSFTCGTGAVHEHVNIHMW